MLSKFTMKEIPMTKLTLVDQCCMFCTNISHTWGWPRTIHSSRVISIYQVIAVATVVDSSAVTAFKLILLTSFSISIIILVNCSLKLINHTDMSTLSGYFSTQCWVGIDIQWNLRERDALGKWPMSLIERSSLSRRFVFFHLIIHVCFQYIMNYLQLGLVMITVSSDSI